MNSRINTRNSKVPLVKTLFLAIAAQTLAAGYSHAGPTGGVIAGGAGNIESTGSTTRINQDTHRLSLEWDTFNVAADERVEFVQPSSSATALNRILDNNGSNILGQIDANGHVILMNPNGVFFGENATVNVGGLVASGLNIDSAGFMNGDLVLSAIEGTSGAVVNSGVINAATGGNVALIGKTVANHGLISANLGHVALASGSEAVVTFDDQGLIGVRIDKETLASEVDGDYAVENAGTVEAQGGKILLNASVSADLFSKAVNNGNMGGSTQAVVHDDGSFTLGGGNSVVNTGTMDVSTDADSVDDAGHVVLAGATVDQDGVILANAEADNQAGHVYAEASGSVNLGASSVIEASAADSTSGKVSLEADSVVASTGAAVLTSGDTLLTAKSGINAPEVETHNLYIQSTGDVGQTCSITASGNAHLLLANGADVDLSNTANDLNTLSMDARYNTNVQINDRNDLALNDINVVGSSVRIQSLGEGATLSQTADGHIQLYGSDLHLEADNVVLGEEGSTTSVNHSSFDVRFADYVNTYSSITLVDDFALMPTTARIRGTVADGSASIEVTGEQAIDLNADFGPFSDGYTLTIAHALGDNARLHGYLSARQTGPITLTGALTWDAYWANLDHPENDIASLQGQGYLAFGGLNYIDKNDVIIRDMDVETENYLSVTSVGEGGTIRQAPDTLLQVSQVRLDADNIELGADGRSIVDAYYTLDLVVGNSLYINGEYGMGNSSGTEFTITGDDGDNSVFFGEHATVSPLGGLPQVRFDLGGGDDDMTFLNDFVVSESYAEIDIDMGDGDDWLAFVGDFIVNGDEVQLEIGMGDGDDWAVFVNGLTVNGGLAEGSRLNMGSGDDYLFFRGDMDIPIMLGSGDDFVLSESAGASFDITDYDSEEDLLVATQP